MKSSLALARSLGQMPTGPTRPARREICSITLRVSCGKSISSCLSFSQVRLLAALAGAQALTSFGLRPPSRSMLVIVQPMLLLTVSTPASAETLNHWSGRAVARVSGQASEPRPTCTSACSKTAKRSRATDASQTGASSSSSGSGRIVNAYSTGPAGSPGSRPSSESGNWQVIVSTGAASPSGCRRRLRTTHCDADDDPGAKAATFR